MTDYVYRHFSEDGELLYVGVTGNLPVRAYVHKLSSAWWNKVHCTTSVPYSTRAEAEAAEAAAILREQPTYNRKGKTAPVPKPLTYQQQLQCVADCVECNLFGAKSIAKMVPEDYGLRRLARMAYQSGQIHGHGLGRDCYLSQRSYDNWLAVTQAAKLVA